MIFDHLYYCCCSEHDDGKQGIELLQDILKTSQWVKCEKLSAALKSPLMRLCARYAKLLLPLCTIHFLSKWNAMHKLQLLMVFCLNVQVSCQRENPRKGSRCCGKFSLAKWSSKLASITNSVSNINIWGEHVVLWCLETVSCVRFTYARGELK